VRGFFSTAEEMFPSEEEPCSTDFFTLLFSLFVSLLVGWFVRSFFGWFVGWLFGCLVG
jgi:hypothetical protein